MLRRNFLKLLGISSPAIVAEVSVASQEPQKRRLFHSVQSGHWDDPLTWDVGEVPTPGSNVMLGGHTITISRAADVATLNGSGSIEWEDGYEYTETENKSWDEIMWRSR